MGTHQKQTQVFRSVVRHYMPFVRQQRVSHVTLLMAYGVGAAVSTLYVPVLYKRIMDAVISGALRSELYLILWLLVAATIGYNVLFRLGDLVIIRMQSLTLKQLSDYALERLQQKSYEFYTNAFVGGLVAKTKRFVAAFEQMHDIIIFSFWMNFVVLLGSIVVLWSNSWVLGATFLLWMCLYVYLVRLMVRWQVPKSVKNAEADSRVTGVLSDVLTNILAVKTFSAEQREQRHFEGETNAQEQTRRTAWMQDVFWNGMLQAFLIAVFNIVMVWIVVELWLRDVVSSGTILLVQVYVITSFSLVWRMSKEIVRLSTAFSNAYEMTQLLDEPDEAHLHRQSEPSRFSAGAIEFQHVTFAYNGNGAIFKDLSFTVRPGERVAFVGHSGAGKTTVAKLLLRFVDVTSGTIRVDGQDIRRVKPQDVRSHVAYVPQEPPLFHRTLRENIAYGNPSASEDDVVNAARHAQIHDFIMGLPDGYDTLVGERGLKLSGGERQRVAIARAMLKHTCVVVWDEATSSLDSVSERNVQRALNELIDGRTTLIIAHRLSTIQHVDRILVFDAGAIVEQGSHAELLAQGGVYEKLWRHQTEL